jgi:hypothetical protein
VPRLVEIGAKPPPSLLLQPGDVLNAAATGGSVEAGADVIEALGSFSPALVALDGAVMSPQTVPTNALFRVLRPGRARIAVFVSAGGFAPAQRTEIDVVVEEAGAVSGPRPA